MTPADVRNLSWEELRDHLAGPRAAVWEWLRNHGPATTTAISEGTGIPLLTVRPRMTELVQLGFADCVGRLRREGVYASISPEAARARLQETHGHTQLPLKLS